MAPPSDSPARAVAVTATRTAPVGAGRGAGSVGLAARNALKLGTSLLGTWGIAVVARLAMPRFLGPEQFGIVNFADALTATVFVLLTFGLDTYIRKEVTLRERHADDFFGAVLLARLGLFAVLLGALWGVMALTDQPPVTRHAVYLFGAGQFFFVANNSLAALLHARAQVGGLSVINVASKLVWAGGVAAALALGGGARAVALAFLVSEALRAFVLLVLCRRHLGLRLSVQPRAAWTVLAASLPFFVSIISYTVCSRVGSSMVGFYAAPDEVGFYGAAWTLAGMALLLAPLLNWVLMPLLSQAAAESPEALLRKARRATELVVALSAPVALVLALGADFWVTFLFGEAYAPAAPALRLMAPVFVLTYVAMICSTTLVLQNRAWAVTGVAVVSLFLNPLLQVLLVPRAGAWFGVGGPGMGAALALLGAELVAVSRLLYALRGGTFDRASVVRTAKLLLVCALVLAVHRTLEQLGPWRLAVDVAVYTLGVLLTGAFPKATFVALAQAVLERRRKSQGELGDGD